MPERIGVPFPPTKLHYPPSKSALRKEELWQVNNMNRILRSSILGASSALHFRIPGVCVMPTKRPSGPRSRVTT